MRRQLRTKLTHVRLHCGRPQPGRPAGPREATTIAVTVGRSSSLQSKLPRIVNLQDRAAVRQRRRVSMAEAAAPDACSNIASTVARPASTQCRYHASSSARRSLAAPQVLRARRLFTG